MTQQPTILICDDDATTREFIATILRHEQFEVIATDNGTDAVTLAKQHRPDLVLLDFMIPEPGGLDTLSELADHSIAPVAMLTSLDDDRDRDAASRRGAIAFLNKAETLRNLGDHVREVLDRCARRDAARTEPPPQAPDAD